ncbi:DNA starvation/stationary phase protection protein [Prevotella scopos JCM 17725]|uniref:Dps family protein n=1 Tax=Prevotella scopos TaxID=589437 RepID=UPI0005C5C0FD|nr:Dps family protein [Prevotella scopos]ANR72478.1 DNA starvation/stationary phase protection protein [Prevotella scopos JCM 17725]QUB46344.1 DNA starvation/stationary phase protection protein [Prevotella scopos JCM 17725]
MLKTRTLDLLGLDEKKVQNVVNELSVLLADFQVFYSNLRNFHWNVKGHGFFVLHSKYEELYNDAAEKVDEVAERILQLGSTPESRFSEYLKVTEIKEADVVSCSKEAVNLLLDYYKTLIARERRIIELASDAHDDTTVSLVSDFLKEQEKTVWMLVATKSQSCAE